MGRVAYRRYSLGLKLSTFIDTESEVDIIPEDYFDVIIESCDTQDSIRKVKNYLNGMMRSQ